MLQLPCRRAIPKEEILLGCSDEIPEIFCWTKMGSEAGQSLDAILRRKELERQAGNGMFAWGIGNSLGTSAELARKFSPSREVNVLFTPMKSAPKSTDENPSNLLLWLAYLQRDGRVVDLPGHVLVTSRGGSGKRVHYALLCRSDAAIIDQVDGSTFDAVYATNLASSNPIGASQVTSIVRYDQQNGGWTKNQSPLKKPYRVAFRAKFSGEGFVRLTHPIVLSGSVMRLYRALLKVTNAKEWLDRVYAIRSAAQTTAEHSYQNYPLGDLLTEMIRR